jgi:hypothetical protein
LQDGQNDIVDAGEKLGHRVARGRAVEHELCVDDVLGADGIERENAHAGAKFEVDYVDGAADADDQVARPKGAGDGGKENAALDEIFGAGVVEERFYVSENRPQGVLDIVERDDVAVDLLAGDPRKRTFVLDEKRHSRMERRAAIRGGG